MNGCADRCNKIHHLVDEIINDPETQIIADGAAMKRIRKSCMEIQRLCGWMESNCFYGTEAGGMPGDDY